MFKNIGFKIMTLAEILCWIGIVISVVLGIYQISTGINTSSELLIVYGVLIIIFGTLFSWIGSFLLYGFGRLIENTDIIANRNENQ